MRNDLDLALTGDSRTNTGFLCVLCGLWPAEKSGISRQLIILRWVTRETILTLLYPAKPDQIMVARLRWTVCLILLCKEDVSVPSVSSARETILTLLYPATAGPNNGFLCVPCELCERQAFDLALPGDSLKNRVIRVHPCPKKVLGFRCYVLRFSPAQRDPKLGCPTALDCLFDFAL